MKILITFFLFFSLSYCKNSFAQENSDSTIIESVDANSTGDTESNDDKPKENTYVRHYMDEKRLEALRSKSEFKYPDLENDTLKTTRRAEAPPADNSFKGFDVSIFLWLIVAVAVVLVVLQLVGLNFRQLFAAGKLRIAEKQSEDLPENIHEIPFDKAIQDAINNANYSLATRLMYLQALKILSDKNIISWHENKTNWQYVYEIKNWDLRSHFRNITSIFEYVRYGNMTVSAESFAIVQNAFRNFRMNIV